MLYPRRRRRRLNLVKTFGAGPVITCSIFTKHALMMHLNLQIDLKDMNAKSGPLI